MTLVVGGRRGRRSRADNRSPAVLYIVDQALAWLRGGFVGVRRSRGRSGRQRISTQRRRIENELFDGNDLLSVAEFLKLAEQRSDLVDETLSFLPLQLTKHLLNNVVSVLITHQTQERALASLVRRCQCANDLLTLRLFTKFDALFDHIARKFVLRIHEQLRQYNVDHTGSILFFAIFDHVLNDIVSELVWDKVSSASMKLSQDGFPVYFFTMLKHALDDSASIWVRGQPAHLSLEGVDDELHVLRWNSFNGLLDDMVTILVTDTLKHVVLKLLDHGCLLVGKDMFQRLLDNATPIHLGGQGKHMALHLIGKNLFLGLVAMLEELLDNVVAKHVCHQLQAVGLDFAEHLLFLVAIRCLQLLLNES